MLLINGQEQQEESLLMRDDTGIAQYTNLWFNRCLQCLAVGVYSLAIMELIKGVSMSDAAIAGAVSGCLTRAVLSPVDVVKIRFQLQLEPIKVWNIYIGMVNGFRWHTYSRTCIYWDKWSYIYCGYKIILVIIIRLPLDPSIQTFFKRVSLIAWTATAVNGLSTWKSTSQRIERLRFVVGR